MRIYGRIAGHIVRGLLINFAVISLFTETGSAQRPNLDPKISIQQLRVPENAKAELNKSKMSFLKGDRAASKIYVDRALKIHPSFANALAWRGVMASEEPGLLPQACADLEKAIQYDPELSLAYVVLGMIYNRMARPSDAQKVLEIALRLDSRQWQAHYEASRAAIALGDFDSAVAHEEQALALRPDAPRKVAALKATIGSLRQQFRAAE